MIKPGEKIKFPFCTDLLIENSLYNKRNEHYFHDPLLIEFWTNYNNNRKYLYTTVQKHIKMDRDIIQSCVNNIQISDPINRSSLLFLSNNLSEGHMYVSKIIEKPDVDNLSKLFVRTNRIKDFKTTKYFKPDSTTTVLECLACNSHIKETFYYFNKIIEKSDNIYVITDNGVFKKMFRNHIHINNEYYLCYDKEQQ